MSALTSLRERLAEVADLGSLAALAEWDQHTMMPREGIGARGQQVATIRRLAHERATDDVVGEWLEQLEADASELADLDRDIVRIARRDWDRSRRVPSELVAELAQASSAGQDAWAAARAASDFAAFAPALERNVELARAYAACFADADTAYDALLADYDFGVRSDRLTELFDELAAGLTPLIADRASDPDGIGELEIPVAAQQAAVRGVLRRIGVDDAGWRLDVSAHPFSESVSRLDTRITVRYTDHGLQSMLSALHEYGHGLYERQIAPELERTGLGVGTSMSMHESQSKLWENHVCANRAFAPVLADELARGGFTIQPSDLHAALTRVRPSLIRVSADQVTYPLHVVLRFELEHALIEGRLDVADLPGAWNDGMRRLLGVGVARDADGVLQDIHWSAGSFGYFPSYAVGCLIAAQLWEQLEIDLGSQDEALEAGEVSAVQEWLADHIHRHGRRLDTEPLVEQATGRGLEVEPFLRHVSALVDGSSASRTFALAPPAVLLLAGLGRRGGTLGVVLAVVLMGLRVVMMRSRIGGGRGRRGGPWGRGPRNGL